jgi:hypothetical protein
VERVLDGEGSAWEPAPSEADDREAAFEVSGPSDQRVLYFPATDDDRTVSVGVEGPQPLLELDDVGFQPLALNEAARSAYGEGGLGDEVPELPEPTEPDADGRYTFDLEGGYPALLLVGADVQGPTPLTVTSSQPFAVVADDHEPEPLVPGAEPAEGTLGYFDPTEVFTVDLEAGDEIDVVASSASGDVAFTVVAPGDTLDTSEEFDDGAGGLFDLDAQATFSAEVGGPHQVWVYQVEGVATGYRLSVDAA